MLINFDHNGKLHLEAKPGNDIIGRRGVCSGRSADQLVR